MSKFETRFAADDDAERIRAAFYDFAERHADDKTSMVTRTFQPRSNGRAAGYVYASGALRL